MVILDGENSNNNNDNNNRYNLTVFEVINNVFIYQVKNYNSTILV